VRGWIIRAGIIGVIVVGGLIFRDRLSSNAGDLKVGDCFDLPAANVDIKDVQHHPCTERHTGEVFATVNHPAPKDAPALTDAAFADFLDGACQSQWIAWVGQTAASADVLTFGGFYPGDKAWADGERGVTCFTYRNDEQPMTGSAKTP
jgi:hypothetical protein